MYTSAIVILINLIGMIFFFLVFYLVILYNLAINTCSCLNKQTEITKELNNITAPLRGSLVAVQLCYLWYAQYAQGMHRLVSLVEAHQSVHTLENGMISTNTVNVRMVPLGMEILVVYIFFRIMFH
jgi:hypothetical protein